MKNSRDPCVLLTDSSMTTHQPRDRIHPYGSALKGMFKGQIAFENRVERVDSPKMNTVTTFVDKSLARMTLVTTVQRVCSSWITITEGHFGWENLNIIWPINKVDEVDKLDMCFLHCLVS
jgi:hypothetical protein